MPRLDQRLHEPEQQRKEQRPDVLPVHVGVRHQDDLVVAELGDVELVVDPGPERRDHRLDLVVLEDAVDPRLLHVDDLAPDGQDGLELNLPAALGRAAGRVALDQEDLGDRRVSKLEVGQLAW